MNKYKFNAGLYYVGDPCYAIQNDKDWEYVCDQIGDNNEAHFKFKGYNMWLHRTAWGDGSYLGSDGNLYAVDSGTIGVVRADSIKDEPDFLGIYAFIVFDKPFEVWYNKGTFYINDIVIHTDETSTDEYDEEDSWEDEEEEDGE